MVAKILSQKWFPKTMHHSCLVALTCVTIFVCLALWMYETSVYKFCIILSSSKMCNY